MKNNSAGAKKFLRVFAKYLHIYPSEVELKCEHHAR